MPFYEYKCVICEHRFEEFQPISDDPLEDCPECGGKVKRLISNVTSQVVKDSKELGEQIKQEAKQDAQDIRNGDWEKAADYLGEDGALDFYNKR